MFSPDLKDGFGNLSQGRGWEHEPREVIKEEGQMKSLSSKDRVHSHPPPPTFHTTFGRVGLRNPP